MILLLITGTMGSGKTAVMAEASDLLTTLKIAHAAIDLDALGSSYLPNLAHHDHIMYKNLASVAENYRRIGLTRFLVARAVENQSEFELCCQAIGATETVTCRLVANREIMKKRVAERERGMLRQEFVERVTTLNEILDRAGIEDLTISNENRSVTDVAREMLVRVGWISG